MFTCVCAFFFIIATVFGGDQKQARLRYYYESFDNFTEFPFENATDIFTTSWYNSSRVTKVFCHGFTGHPNGPAVTAVTKKYIEDGKYNVILLNWEHLAAPIDNVIANSYLNWALPNAKKVAAAFATVLLSLSELGFDLDKTHLIGHSLGAHIMGLAGYALAKKDVLLPWVTGLDPAGIGFDSKSPQERINPKSAIFVDIIHTDPNKYGSRKTLGTVDFWPNYRAIGRVMQPGCTRQIGPPFKPEDLCDHNRSWEYLLDALKYPGSFLGSHAKNYRAWKKYSNKEKHARVLEMGKFEPNAVPGNYYLSTAAASPYGLGKEGL